MCSALLLAEIRSVRLLLFWLMSASSILCILTAGKVENFKKKERSLLNEGCYFSEYNYSAQTRKLLLILFGTIIAFLLPFFVSSVLGIFAWLGLLLGLIDGWIGALIFYNLYLRKWERTYHGKLYQMQLLRGLRVSHSGISFERETE